MAPDCLARIAPVLVACCAAIGSAQPRSIASSLSEYQATLKVPSVAGISAKSFSGVAFHPETKTLYVIDNDNAVVYELSASGSLLRAITTTGFLDPEGIAYQSGDFFLISEEGLANIVRVKLPRSGTGPVAWSSGTFLNIAPNQSNSGIEGVCFRPGNATAYAVKETGPPRLYRISLDPAGNPAAYFPNEPFNIEGKTGDAADVYALEDGNFLIVNQEQNRLDGYGPQGQALSSLPLGMSKPEGIAIDTADGTLYVVGEPLELSVFKRTVTRSGGGISGESGFSFSVVSGKASGSGPVLRFSLPERSDVRIDFTAPNGVWTEVFKGDMEKGEHAQTQKGRASAAGVGFYRISAGSYHRIVKAVAL